METYLIFFLIKASNSFLFLSLIKKKYHMVNSNLLDY